MQEMRVEGKALQDFMTRVFAGLGMPPDDAALEAEVLVWANMRGVDSHGVQRIGEYARGVDEGRINPKPNIRIEKQTPATVLVEGDFAFGPIVTVFAMEQVMAKAKEVGVGWGLIRNTAHQGAMGYYTEMAVKRDMVGIAVCSNRPNMAPTGAKKAGTHNSPISIAVPGDAQRSVNLDMATSVAAFGKLHVAADRGVSIPEDWALDKGGQPTTDPKQAALLRPTGDYKGYGLAMMFECLSSVLVGNPLVGPSIAGQPNVPPGTQNSFVVALDIGAFTDPGDFKGNIDMLVGALKGLPRQDEDEEIYVPGEKEDRLHLEREEKGIPLPVGTVEKLQVAAERFGVEMPESIS